MFSVPEPAEPPSPESLDFWSYYGACHVAEKLGRAGRGPGVLLDWAADAVRWIDCSCEVERQKVDGQPVGQGRPLRWEWQAAGAPGGQLAGMAGPWVVLGPLLPLAGACVLHAEVGGVTIALATLGPDKSVKFGWPIFAQIGLLLSRYSWSGVPGFQGFVRAVDPLWDKLIRPVCGQRPLVDELVELVRSAALMLAEKENAPLAELCPWPLSTNERPYDAALTFTHDVDAVYADERFRGRPAAEQRGNVWFNFMRWQELERGLGVKSAFYLMAPAGELRQTAQTANYDLSDPAVMEAVGRLVADGWEIGPHLIGAEPDAISAQVDRFASLTGRRPLGTRSHYLAHAHDALDAKHRAGLIYDSTWYAEQADTAFLCGTVFPFRPVSTCTGRILELVELPNVIEDGIVFGVYGEGTQRDTDGAVADGRRAIDAAVRRNGAVVFNWHQRVFALMDRYGNTPADWTVAYRRLAEYALEQPVDWWVALPSEIARWWLLRRQVRVSLLSDEVEVSNHACQEFQGALRLIWPNAEDVRPVTIQPNRSIRVRLRTR